MSNLDVQMPGSSAAQLRRNEPNHYQQNHHSLAQEGLWIEREMQGEQNFQNQNQNQNHFQNRLAQE